MSENFIPQTKADEIERQISEVLSPTTTVTVVETVEQRDNACALGKAVKSVKAELDETRKTMVRPHLDAQREINDWFNRRIENLSSVELNLKNVIVAFDRAQEQKRLEEQRRLDEEARKIREKSEAEARAQREKEEAERRKAEEARQAAEAARIAAENAANEEERARLAAEAAKADAAAAKAESKAETLADKAALKETVAASVVSATATVAPKAAGVSVTKKYSIEVLDKRALIAWCLEQSMFDGLSFVDINEGALNKIVQAMKGKIGISGVRIVESDQVSMRKAA